MKKENMTVPNSTKAEGGTTEETEFNCSALSNKQRAMVMMPLLLGGFISILNETILNVAFPQLMAGLNVSMSTIQWLGTAYMLIIGILVPVAAFLLKTFSTRNLYIAAMALFAAGTVFCGLAESFPALLVARVLQGAGTGMLLPIMIDTIAEIFPPEKRGAAMGIGMMVVVAAPGFGPAVSGLILQNLDWHWLFWAILPFPVIAIVLGFVFLRSYSVLTKPKIDILSVIFSTLGFGGLIFGICSVETMGFANMTVIIAILCGTAGLILFTKRQLSLKQPMLELRVLRNPLFTIGTFILFISFMIPFAINIILPTYMQSVMGLSAFISGIALLPGCLVNVIVTPVSGRIFDRFGARKIVFIGFVALTSAMFFLSQTSVTTPLAMIIILQAIMTLGIALIIVPVQTNSLNQLPREYCAHGTAILNTTQQIAGAFGSSLFIGLMGAVQAKQLEGIADPGSMQQQLAAVTGLNTAFTAALALVIAGLGLAFFLKSGADEVNDFDAEAEPEPIEG